MVEVAVEQGIQRNFPACFKSASNQLLPLPLPPLWALGEKGGNSMHSKVHSVHKKQPSTQCFILSPPCPHWLYEVSRHCGPTRSQ